MKTWRRKTIRSQSATCQDPGCLFRELGSLSPITGRKHAENNPGHEVIVKKSETLTVCLVEMADA